MTAHSMHFVNEQTLLAEHKKQARKKATGIDGGDKTVCYSGMDSMESIKKSPPWSNSGTPR